MLGKGGFTIIELVVVIAIIAVLSAIVTGNIMSNIVKARDTKRKEDMTNIYKALVMYHSNYGCLPITSGTTCPGAGGYADANLGAWDYSSQGSTNFLSFLTTAGYMSKVPVDPINNMTSDGSPTGTYSYRYYCYPGQGLHLGYWKEQGTWGEYLVTPEWLDSSFVCK